MPTGSAYWIGNAIVQTGKTPQEIAEEMAEGKLDITKLPTCSKEEASEALKPSIKATFERIDMQKAKREEYLKTIGEGPEPYIYVIVATGNIYEDVIQAQAAARQGADIIAVIRTTAQSLLDYVQMCIRDRIERRAGGDTAEIEKIILNIVETTGKHKNPWTGSGGMLIGKVAEVGPNYVGDLKKGDKIATLVSLSLTPLRIDEIIEIRPDIDQIDIKAVSYTPLAVYKRQILS